MPELTSDLTVLASTAVLAYLLGSIPFGIVMTRLFGLGDLRSIGSGNIGATNVLRTGNKLAAALTVILDGAKGGIAVLIARWLVAEDAAQVAGLAAFLGHLFPLYLNFRGGKGVATFLGTVLALSPPVGAACCLTWLVVALITRISSLAALFAASTSLLWVILLTRAEPAFAITIMVVLVFVRHRDNISRLRAGTEPKIGATQ
ncbi:MAG: glycerol-3-phosphate 1-O-acyltransferase PlsY [Pseudomonadota bacterium]